MVVHALVYVRDRSFDSDIPVPMTVISFYHASSILQQISRTVFCCLEDAEVSRRRNVYFLPPVEELVHVFRRNDDRGKARVAHAVRGLSESYETLEAFVKLGIWLEVIERVLSSSSSELLAVFIQFVIDQLNEDPQRACTFKVAKGRRGETYYFEDAQSSSQTPIRS